MGQAVVVAGAGPLSPLAIEAVRDGAFIVAADSGLDYAVAVGLVPDVLVGDLDSITAAGRMWAYEHAAEIEEHEPDKDLTDTELAITRALRVPDVDDLLLLCGSNSAIDERLDHLFGIVLALGHPALAVLDQVRAVIGTTQFRVLHAGRSATLELDPGQQFSLLALHGPCTGVNASGARWPLIDATLTASEARGVSNEATSTPEVSVRTGVLTVVIP
ncbi:MAG: thiamine diphosphokinase [Actinomycetia bacterium]|nr:thiamine diphosphokinase [Actinomycetes bacterium]